MPTSNRSTKIQFAKQLNLLTDGSHLYNQLVSMLEADTPINSVFTFRDNSKAATTSKDKTSKERILNEIRTTKGEVKWRGICNEYAKRIGHRTYKVKEPLVIKIDKDENKPESKKIASDDPRRYRPLSVPNTMDKLVSSIIQHLLRVHYSLPYPDKMFAFLPTRIGNTKKANQSFMKHPRGSTSTTGLFIKRYIRDGYRYISEIDIVGAFDNICHTHLRRKLRQHGISRRMTKLIMNLIPKSNKGKGIPQGSPISDWLFSLATINIVENNTAHTVVCTYADNIYIMAKDTLSLNQEKERIATTLLAQNLMVEEKGNWNYSMHELRMNKNEARQQRHLLSEPIKTLGITIDPILNSVIDHNNKDITKDRKRRRKSTTNTKSRPNPTSEKNTYRKRVKAHRESSRKTNSIHVEEDLIEDGVGFIRFPKRISWENTFFLTDIQNTSSTSSVLADGNHIVQLWDTSRRKKKHKHQWIYFTVEEGTITQRTIYSPLKVVNRKNYTASVIENLAMVMKENNLLSQNITIHTNQSGIIASTRRMTTKKHMAKGKWYFQNTSNPSIYIAQKTLHAAIYGNFDSGDRDEYSTCIKVQLHKKDMLWVILDMIKKNSSSCSNKPMSTTLRQRQYIQQ